MSTSLKPIQDANHIENTGMVSAVAAQELPMNDHNGSEWPINIPSSRTDSTGDEACEFGVAYDPSLIAPPIVNEFHDLKFTFAKKKRTSCCSCSSSDRNVVIALAENGREIQYIVKKEGHCHKK